MLGQELQPKEPHARIFSRRGEILDYSWLRDSKICRAADCLGFLHDERIFLHGVFFALKFPFKSIKLSLTQEPHIHHKALNPFCATSGLPSKFQSCRAIDFRSFQDFL